MTMTTITDSTDVFLVRGIAVWIGTERHSSMIRWINVETVGPLVSESARIGEVPDWAEPAPPGDTRLVRAAAVGIGWPLPLLAAKWRADRGDEVFPPPAERDTSGESPKEAVRRTLDGDPKAKRTLLVPHAMADALLLALPWWLLLRGDADDQRQEDEEADHANDDLRGHPRDREPVARKVLLANAAPRHADEQRKRDHQRPPPGGRAGSGLDERDPRKHDAHPTEPPPRRMGLPWNPPVRRSWR
jgi:hypothetical protein